MPTSKTSRHRWAFKPEPRIIAKSQHTCSLCGQHIHVGETYRRAYRGIKDGKHVVYLKCVRCVP